MVTLTGPRSWLIAAGLVVLIGLSGDVHAGARSGPEPAGAGTGGLNTTRRTEGHATREEAPMAVEDNKAVVRRWFQAFNDRDMATEEAVRASDFLAYVAGVPGPLDGEGWRQFTGAFITAFPDLQLTIDDMLAKGERVAVRWTLHGTQLGTFQGIAPTGKPVSISAIEVNRVSDGKVAEHWVVLDQLSLLQQLGVIPAPGQ